MKFTPENTKILEFTDWIGRTPSAWEQCFIIAMSKDAIASKVERLKLLHIRKVEPVLIRCANVSIKVGQVVEHEGNHYMALQHVQNRYHIKNFALLPK